MKILSLWPWPQGHPRDGDGADKNFRPISTIMPNMNEIHRRVFKILGLINFNAKTLTLWWKDERMNIRTSEQTDERKSENYIPPHTSYVGGINRPRNHQDKYFEQHLWWLFKQEDHDGPISLTWANSFAYLLLKFQPSSLLIRFLYKFYSPAPQRLCFFQASWWFELNLERGSPKEQFCQVILKSVQWFLTKRFLKCFK